jgi:hypothetical protein
MLVLTEYARAGMYWVIECIANKLFTDLFYICWSPQSIREGPNKHEPGF